MSQEAKAIAFICLQWHSPQYMYTTGMLKLPTKRQSLRSPDSIAGCEHYFVAYRDPMPTLQVLSVDTPYKLGVIAYGNKR